jgi:hypothetical protein
LAFMCFNAAVTAWQLADWVWRDCTPEQRQRLNTPRLGDLQARARQECRALYLCRQIATASKHWEVTSFRAHDVGTEFRIGPPQQLSGPAYRRTWEAVIVDRGVERNAVDVFHEASDYWANLIHLERIAA